MDRSTDDPPDDWAIEILPPERPRESNCLSGVVRCPCCQELYPASCMDEDGCGICEECLAP